ATSRCCCRRTPRTTSRSASWRPEPGCRRNRRCRWITRSTRCARPARAFCSTSPLRTDGPSRRWAAPSAARPLCGSANSAACARSWLKLISGTRRCSKRPRCCAASPPRCRGRSGPGAAMAVSAMSTPPMHGRPRPPASRTPSAAISNCLTAATAARWTMPCRPAPALPRGCRSWSAASGASTMCAPTGSAAAAPASRSTPAKPAHSARHWCGWRRRIAAPSTSCRPASRSSTTAGGSPSTTIPTGGCGISIAPSSTTIPTIRACLTGCAPRKLPEQPDFRAWKAKLHEAYRAVEPEKDTWYLPDGRAVRVVTTPNPEGGVTYLFDDVTESLELARRFDGLIRVQRETLDSLAEAVAVFGSNGRAQLFNPAFARMWKLSPEALQQQPHIETVEAWCRPLFDDAVTWRTIREAITAIENRADVPLKLERKDGSVLDCMTRPMPDGATMLTFQDITDTENVERALRERAEALETADQMKVDFVHHVSYELRSPLTTIIGFAHLLTDPATGPLMPKQAEYLDYITASTSALFALINNILDLATIDAGAMTLELGTVDIRKT